jgi:G3E family GTPase
VNAVQLPRQPVPIVLLTGFLGSGKTTLLNQALADPSLQDTAVLVNEFGAIGVDHLLVSAVAEDVVLLASGCLCCTAGDDLGAALASLLARRKNGALPPFQRVVIETTGIAEPGAVVQRLLYDRDLAAQIRLQDVVTVVDAMFGATALEQYSECANQVALASRLIISKLDLVEEGRVGSLAERLRAINPTAEILLSGRGRLPRGFLFVQSNGAARPYAAIATSVSSRTGLNRSSDHANRYTTFAWQWDEPTDWDDFKAWLEGLLIARGDSILRMKGLLQVAGHALPVVLQSVQHALYPPKDLASWPLGAPRSELVFITRDFSSAAAVRSFRQLLPYHVIAS